MEANKKEDSSTAPCSEVGRWIKLGTVDTAVLVPRTRRAVDWVGRKFCCQKLSLRRRVCER